VSLQVYLTGCEPPGYRKPKAPGQPPRPIHQPKPALPREEALRLIDEQLSAPLPAKYRWIERITPPGDVVVRFLLPAELCRRENQRRQLAPNATPRARAAAVGIAKRERHDLFQMLYSQWLLYSTQPPTPLSGRPWVRAIRFGGHEPDPGAGWSKAAVDLLTVQRRKPHSEQRYEGLGIVHDDRGSELGRAVWWEPFSPDHAPVVLVEVWTGCKAKATKVARRKR
jgi:hypothetical protein